MVKNEKFQCPLERGGPEDFKNHLTFVPSTIFGGVMAFQTWEHFFWDTLYIYLSGFTYHQAHYQRPNNIDRNTDVH